MLVFVLILQLITLLLYFVHSEPAHLSNKTYIFVSGWPQSGTSLIQQILNMAPGMSSMVNKCSAFHGKKCVNFNHEGQWMVGLNKSVTRFIKAGKMCPLQSIRDTSLPSGVSDIIFDEWHKVWSYEGNAYLVEKSPASMMKLNTMANLIHRWGRERQVNVKFLIVLKHPVTLNIASMKHYEWLTHFDVKRLIHSKGRDRQVIPNTPEEMHKNLQFFYHLMLKNNFEGSYSYMLPHSHLNNNSRFDTKAGYRSPEFVGEVLNYKSNVNSTSLSSMYEALGSERKCIDMGWLDAFDYLRYQLNVLDIDAKIVRYEDFSDAHRLCSLLFKFLYISGGNQDNWLFRAASRQICDRYFSGGQQRKLAVDECRAGNRAHCRSNTKRENGNGGSFITEDGTIISNNSVGIDHRVLRLRSVEDYRSLHFDANRMRQSVEARISAFQMLITLVATPEDIDMLRHIQTLLVPFGYSLFLKPGNYKPSVTYKQRFSESKSLSGRNGEPGALNPWLNKTLSGVFQDLLEKAGVDHPLGRASSPSVFNDYDIMVT